MQTDPTITDLLGQLTDSRHHVPTLLSFMELPEKISTQYLALRSREDWDATKHIVQQRLIQILCMSSSAANNLHDSQDSYAGVRHELLGLPEPSPNHAAPFESGPQATNPIHQASLMTPRRFSKPKVWRCPDRRCKRHRQPYSSEGNLTRHMRADHNVSDAFYEDIVCLQRFQPDVPIASHIMSMLPRLTSTYQSFDDIVAPPRGLNEQEYTSQIYPCYPWLEPVAEPVSQPANEALNRHASQ